MAKVIVVLILISISTIAKASDWKYITTNSDGDTFYVDAKSVLVEGDTRTFWVYRIRKTPKTVQDATSYTEKTQASINCAKRIFRFLVLQDLDSKGMPVESVEARAKSPVQPINPDSIMDAIRKYVCSIERSTDIRRSGWRYIATTADGDIVYVDGDSILVKGDTRTYWSLTKFKEPEVGESGIAYSESRSQEIIDCVKRTRSLRIVQLQSTKGQSSLYSDAKKEYPSTQNAPIIPDSIADTIRKYVCFY